MRQKHYGNLIILYLICLNNILWQVVIQGRHIKHWIFLFSFGFISKKNQEKPEKPNISWMSNRPLLILKSQQIFRIQICFWRLVFMAPENERIPHAVNKNATDSIRHLSSCSWAKACSEHVHIYIYLSFLFLFYAGGLIFFCFICIHEIHSWDKGRRTSELFRHQ